MGNLSEAFAQAANAVTNIRSENRESRRLDLFASEMQQRTLADMLRVQMEQQRLKMEQELQPWSVATAKEKLADMEQVRAANEATLKQQQIENDRATELWNSGKPFRDFARGIGERLNAGAAAQAANGGDVPPISPSGTIASLLDAGVPASVLGMPVPDSGPDLQGFLSGRMQGQALAGMLGAPISNPSAAGPPGDVLGDFVRGAQATVQAQTAVAAARAAAERDRAAGRIQQILSSDIFAGSPSMQQAIAEHMQKLGIGSLKALGTASQDSLDELLSDVENRRELMSLIDRGMFK